MDKKSTEQLFFSENLLRWHDEENDRSYPWKKEKDPYRIWLSEIILQQTRSEQGLPYYLKFIDKFPNLESLAKADEEEVFRLWQGLGYYIRCKNLLFSAKQIFFEQENKFPNTYDGLLKLKGVGPYTAAAISSFAYDLPHAVVDGNVFRVLSRYFGIETIINSNEGKKEFHKLANQLINKQFPSDYNQAIMDFGAAVCKPKKPLCATCYLSEKCVAFNRNIIDLLPIKENKIKVKSRKLNYFFLTHGDQLFLNKRTESDIWQNLYEFYLIEDTPDFLKSEKWKALEPFIADQEFDIFHHKQRLTHQLIESNFHHLTLKQIPDFLSGKTWISEKLLDEFAFPKTIISFLDRKDYF